MAVEFAINRLSKHLIDKHVEEILKTCPVVLVTLEDPAERDSGRWTMSRLWRSWMTSTAEYMAKKGSRMPVMAEIHGKPSMMFFHKDAVITKWREFDNNDAHEAFTMKYMGTDKNGERYSWERTKKPGKAWADKGMRVNAMLQHQVWMLEKGVKYLDPKESEFRNLVETLGLN